MKLIDRLDAMDDRVAFACGLALVLVVGAVDYLSGYQFGCSAFYLVPVVLVAWKNGVAAGMAASAIAAGTWLAIDLVWQSRYAHAWLPYWNAAVRFMVFGVVTVLLTALKGQRTLVRTDSLTGLWNRIGLHERLGDEIARCRRSGRSFSLAFIDVDNFKQVNDAGGHDAGDALLVAVGRTLQARLRESDTSARVGGDEFALLLPETPAEAAESLMREVHTGLLKAMRDGRFPVTFSIGVVTFTEVPASPHEALSLADRVMYEVKEGGKDALRCLRAPDVRSSPSAQDGPRRPS